MISTIITIHIAEMVVKTTNVCGKIYAVTGDLQFEGQNPSKNGIRGADKICSPSPDQKTLDMG